MSTTQQALSEIARLLFDDDLDEAQDFAEEVQSYCDNKPSYTLIVQAVQQRLRYSWDIEAEDIARLAELYGEEQRIQRVLADVSTRRAKAYLFQGHIARQKIGFTGNGPYTSYDLGGLVLKLDGYVAHEDELNDLHMFIIGREYFDEEELEQALTYDYDSNINFMAQEDFLNFVLFGVEPNYHRGDPRIDCHPGLSYLASLGYEWPWPSTEIMGSGGTYEWDTDHWSEESPLRARFGYSVAKSIGLTARQRQRILERALTTKNDPLDLYQVAYHIAWLIRSSKWAEDGRYDDAIAKWEEDLDYLKRTFYDDSFRWPRS